MDGRNTGERLQVDPNNGSVLFLGTNQDGLWKSTDHGATWAQVTTFPATSCTLVLFDKTVVSANNVTQTIYVGVNSTTSTSLYRSADGGATWSAVPGQPAGQQPGPQGHAQVRVDLLVWAETQALEIGRQPGLDAPAVALCHTHF